MSIYEPFGEEFRALVAIPINGVIAAYSFQTRVAVNIALNMKVAMETKVADSVNSTN